MWILPKNYQLSSHFAQDMVESKEDLTLPGLNIESSLMWRSKPSPLRTWSRRWKPGSYLPHLFTRILKPSQQKYFEEKLASSLEDIHVNLSQQQGSDSEKMTQDTSGPTYGDTSNQLDLLDASLKTSRDTSRLDSPASSATWKKIVTEQRGEYSQRVKLAHLTKENESTSWLSPTTIDISRTPSGMQKRVEYRASIGRKYVEGCLTEQVMNRQQNWPTPQAMMPEQTYETWKARMERKTDPKSKNKKVPDNLAIAVKLRDSMETTESWPTVTVNGNYNRKGVSKTSGDGLATVVRNWATPAAHEARLGYQDRSDPTKKGTQKSLTTVVIDQAGGRSECPGQRNPEWVEWLMGVPTGWTGLGSWETE